MKVLPSLLRKGKSPIFLKPRGDDNKPRASSSSRRRDGSFPTFGTAASSDDFIIKPRWNDAPAMPCPEPSTGCMLPSSTVDNMANTPPILPTISYPPLTEDPIPPNSLQSHYRCHSHHSSSQPEHDHDDDYDDNAYRGIQKYYSNTTCNSRHEYRKLYGSERPAGSFDYCNDANKPTLLDSSPVGVNQFESLTQFQGLKRDVSLLGLMSRRSSSSTSENSSLIMDEDDVSNGLGALEELTKSQEPDVYLDEDDTCDIEFSRASNDDDDEDYDSSETMDQVTVESATVMTSTSALGEDSTLAGGGGAAASSSLPTPEEEEDTAFFSEYCEYDTKADETVDLTAMYEIRKEIKVTTMQHGDLDTIDENDSHDDGSQLNDEGSVSSSYLFSLVDDGAEDLFRMKRRKRKARANRRSRRQQQQQGPLFSHSLMQEELHNDIIAAASQQQQQPQMNDDEYTASCHCPCSISFTKVKQDVKNTYMDATKAWNQVLYAFFVVEEDVVSGSVANKIRGAKFQEGDQSKMPKSMLV